MRVHPDTKTLLFHMRFLIFSDTFTFVCLLIFIIGPPTMCNCWSVVAWSSNLVFIGDTAIFIFCHFGWKLPIHAILGAYFPLMTSPIVLTPKRHYLRSKHVV